VLLKKESSMSMHYSLLAVVGVGAVFIAGCGKTSSPTSPSASSNGVSTAFPAGSASTNAEADESLSAATLEELALARNATAKYHDVEQALADGYVRRGSAPGEGIHFVKASLIDCTFDAEHPEALLYVPSGEGLRLVGAEYSVPSSCTTTAPEGFSGDADEWEANAEGRAVWGLVAWLWMANPNGIFAEPPHPLIS
jgi:hypothetical protein